MNPRRIILDVDTGHDDALAIMMAAKNPSILLEAITVTAGNQFLPKTLKNTLNLCSDLGIAAPVYAGMTRPLLADLKPAAYIHGESGFDGPVFPKCERTAAREHAVNFIARKIMESGEGEITLVATGPLSNVAMAIRLEPAIATRVREIVLMGGSIAGGNVTPSAEFNIYADPEAASVVFDSGANITMLGLNVTTTVLLSRDRLERYAAIPTRAAEIFGASMRHYYDSCEKFIGECPAMHDPCCVAYVADPSIFTAKKYRVDVELSGIHTRGRTVVDIHGATGKTPNANVVLTADEGRFWAMLEAALRQYRSLA